MGGAEGREGGTAYPICTGGREYIFIYMWKDMMNSTMLILYSERVAGSGRSTSLHFTVYRLMIIHHLRYGAGNG